MCGLSGVVYDANLDAKQLELFRRLLTMNAFRGWDSTGVVDYCHNAKKGNKVLYWKSLKDSATWAGSEFWTNHAERWKKTPPSMLLGHSRAATVGKIKTENAHPFLQGNILGMHNGTVKGEFKNWLNHETDSEVIFHNINTMGVKATLEDVEKHDGAYALVYLNLEEKTLYVIRNSKRPLYYWQADSTSPIFWSSEREMLEICIKSVYGISYKGFPRLFEEGVLYSINYAAYSKTFEWKTEKIIFPKYQGVATYQQGNFHKPEGATQTNTQTNPTGQTGIVSSASILSDPDPWSRKNIERGGHWQYTTFYSCFDQKSNKWFSLFQQNKLLEWDKKMDRLAKEAEAKSTELNDEIPFKDAVKKEPPKRVEWFPIGPGKTSLVSPARFSGLLRHGCASCGCVQFIPKGVPFNSEGHALKDSPPIVWITQEDYLCVDCAADEAFKSYSPMDNSYKLPKDWRTTLEADLEVVMAPNYVTEPNTTSH